MHSLTSSLGPGQSRFLNNWLKADHLSIRITRVREFLMMACRRRNLWTL